MTVAHERVEVRRLSRATRARLTLRELAEPAATRAGGQVIALAAGHAAAQCGEPVRPPIACVYGNCVFADGLDDCWAAFAVRPRSYQWLSEDGKRARLLELLGAIEAIEADLQIVRVARRGSWSGTCASWKCRRTRSVRSTRERTAVIPAKEHHRRLQRRRHGADPAVFLLVSLRDPERDVASYVSQAAESRSARVAERAQARVLAARQARAEGRRARARAGQRRPGARAAGGLPAGQPGARRGAAVADQARVLPRARRAPDRRPARAAGARVRAQRAGAAGAAGGGRAALDGLLRRARGPAAADRVGAGDAAGRRSSCSERCPSGRRSRGRGSS